MTKSRLLKREVGVGMVLVLPLMLGCTNMIGDKEQGILDNAQKAAEGAEADLNACKQRCNAPLGRKPHNDARNTSRSEET